jgi:hypothetical protein
MGPATFRGEENAAGKFAAGGGDGSGLGSIIMALRPAADIGPGQTTASTVLRAEAAATEIAGVRLALPASGGPLARTRGWPGYQCISL